MSLPLNHVVVGDCVEVMAKWPGNSVDCIVTDPPYGLGFMGKEWDRALPPRAAFEQMIRVLKPGALAFVMSSPRQDVLWRMLAMLDGVGFELRQSFISWIYKCVTEDTEVLTIDGWEPFSKSNQFKSKSILIYDIHLDQYRWEVPKLWNSYYIEDTVYRIKSDSTDQLVTRGHRVPIERSGRVLYDFVENLASQSTVLYLDDLSRVWKNLSGDEHFVATRNHLLFKTLQRDQQSKTGSRLGEGARYPPHESLLEITKRARTHGSITEKADWRIKSCLEGRSDLLQNAWELCRCQVCPVSSRIQSDGSERRLYNGTQASRCQTVRSPSEAQRDSASLGSRSLEQRVIQSGTLCLQSISQAIRGREHGYSTTLATITNEHYSGVVFCPTTSTGFWVARRKGKIFITGNTGFPKAYDVSKGIDRKLGLEREVIDIKIRGDVEEAKKTGVTFARATANRNNKAIFGYGIEKITRPASDLAKKWSGWKSQTGLKPALECILMVNKPRSEPTIVDNVLRWGTGAVNVDACRIPLKGEDISDYRNGGYLDPSKENWRFKRTQRDNTTGRFPANLIISDGALDTGETTRSGKFESHHKIAKDENGHTVKNVYGKYRHLPADQQVFYGDEGSPFRFFDLDAWAEHHGFLDVAKPSKAERDFGLTTQSIQVPKSKFNLNNGSKDMRFDGVILTPKRNTHPTCKPVKLMAYLIELGCPPKGIVVDPFLGSGTTCIAAKRLKRRWIGIEINPEYAEIAEARINIRGPLDQYFQARD